MRNNVSMSVLVAVMAVAGCTTGGTVRLPDASLDLDAAMLDTGTGPDDGGAQDAGDLCSEGSTLGDPCAATSDCNDECFCNGLEICVEGVCAVGVAPCSDPVDCTMDSCLEDIDSCTHVPLHEMCQDEDSCNGSEICDRALGCRPAAPLYCNDEDSCTVDSCDSTMGCVHSPRDLDGDGYTDGRCGGDDCDDDPRFGTDIHPGAVEDCTNRRDDNCDGMRDFSDPTCLPTNDTCETAMVITGSGTYSGSTNSLASDYALSCGPASGPDAVFRLTLTEMMDVRATVSTGASTAGVAIRAFASCAAGPDDKCNEANPPAILRRSLPAGDYAVIVKTNIGGVFDLNIMLSDPTEIPPIDVCGPGTEDISAGGVFTGMFAEVEDDYTLSCHASGSWRDAAYTFTITEVQDVLITASSSGAPWTPTTYVSLLTDCSDAGSTLGCASGSTSMLRRRGLEPGTYFVLVESSSTDSTAYSLDVDISDPSPRAVGDACATAVDITSGPGTAELATAELDVGTSCGGTSTSFRDLFFKFSLETTQDVELTTNGGSFHYVALQTECGVLGSELRCRSGGSPLTQSWRSLPPGDYAVVASFSRTTGTVTASVTLSPPTPIPPNDRCAGAIDISGGYTSTDTLGGFEDDVRGCSGTSLPDAFYTFTLTEESSVVLNVDRPADMAGNTTLTLREGDCAAVANVACDTGDPAAISETLAPGTYYLVVEQTAATAGPFVVFFAAF